MNEAGGQLCQIKKKKHPSGNSAHVFNGHWGLFPVKQVGCGDVHSPPSNAEVKNAWNVTEHTVNC